MKKLAINGGEKVRKEKFPPYLPIGNEEKEAVLSVFDSHIFSKYLGCWHEDFYGGDRVRALESAWAKAFNVKYAFAVNSATSALYCAVGALEIEPFDEVIVSPYTMSASATAPLIYNAIPVFADVEKEFFCLDPDDVERKITDRTKAIIVVDIFGQPYSERINEIAKKHNLKVIEDCAQAPYAKLGEKFAGTLGDIGVYSLNYHKHIHSGEGGIVVTNNDELADRISLIRNHAEAVVEAKGQKNLINMIGFNFRMTEIEASIAYEQLKKLPHLVAERVKNVKYLENQLACIPFIKPAKIRENATHVYYTHPILFDENLACISRNRFVEAVQAELMPISLRESEGIQFSSGYVKPLYLQPIFQNKIAYGKSGFPWSLSGRQYEYYKGMCPNVEELHFKKLFLHEYMRPGMTKRDLDDLAMAFIKVSENINELKEG